jgi:hypothetical protein
MAVLRRAAFIAAVGLVAAAGAAPAQAKPLKSNLFQSFGFRVSCGVQVADLGGMSCFSESIPSGELDGVVELHAKGAAEVGERGDSPWVEGSVFKPLKKGRTWRRAGVTCKRFAKLVQCFNAGGNGFAISPSTFALTAER